MRGGRYELTEIQERELSDIDDEIQYCIDTILKEAKLEDRMVKQALYGMLSAYTGNPLNIKVESPSGEGKNYVLHKVAENFPKQDVMFLAGMTDKALFHRTGKLVIKNGNGEYEDIEELIKVYDSRIEDLGCEISETRDNTIKQGLKAQIKSIEDEKKGLYKDARKLIDISNKILIILDTPRPELLNALMSLLSHDSYETEYEYADTTNNGIKTKVNVIRGYPAFFFAQALDTSHYKRHPEIKRRFITINPKMDKEKYKAAIELIGLKFGLPDFAYQAMVVSKAEKERVCEIIRRIKDNILNVCGAIEPGQNNVIVPFRKAVINALRTDDAGDMTVTYRLFSWLSLLPIVKIAKRPRIVFRKKGEVIRQVMPLATYDDLKEAMFLMEYTSGVRPYIMDWNNAIFLKTFNAKTEPNTKILASGEVKTEDRIGVTTEQLVNATKDIQHKTLTSQQILQTYLEPLMNEGYIDRQDSRINAKYYIYYPTGLESNDECLFINLLGPKMNKEQQNNSQDFTDFTHELSGEYIKAEIEKVVACSSGTSIFCEIFNHENKQITIDELVERYYSKYPDNENGRKAKYPPHNTQPPPPPSIAIANRLYDYTISKKIQQQQCRGKIALHLNNVKSFENEHVSDEQQTEPKSSPFDQTEANIAYSTPKNEKSEQGTSDPDSNQNITTFSCRNCNKFETANWQEYDRHTVTKHHAKQGWPDGNGRDSPSDRNNYYNNKIHPGGR